MKKFKNNIFLKIFLCSLVFLLALFFVLLVLAYEQQSGVNFFTFFLNHLSLFFGQSDFLAIIISVLALTVFFAYLLTRKVSSNLFYLKNQAQAIFEGRYLFNNQKDTKPRNDEFDELAFWLDKISLGVKNQRELLAH